MRGIIVLVGLVAVTIVTESSGEGDPTPDEILLRSMDYANVTWNIRRGFAGVVLQDQQYGMCGCVPESPLRRWILGDEYNYYSGAPWSYRVRLKPSEMPDLYDAESPLGRDQCHATCGAISPCCIDGIGHALYATFFSDKSEAWRTWERSDVLAEPDGVTGDSHYVYRAYNCIPDEQHIDEWDLPAEGSILVGPSVDYERAVVVRSIDDGGDLWADECGNEISGRCTTNAMGGNARSLYALGWRALCLRSLCGCPATAFWGLQAERNGAEGRVEWECSYLRNTWGFVVQWSEDGETEWTQIGDYVLAGEADVDHAVGFGWEGELAEGYLRVLEIERDLAGWEASMIERVE